MGTSKVRERGFTLIEVIIAIAILLVGTLAIVPLFVFASETAQVNTRRTIAANLANARLEQIRAMDFKDIGVEGGNPAGKLKGFETKTIDGVDYQLETFIAWEAEADDCTSEEPGEILWDYKLVQIKVITDAPNRLGAIREEMQTLVARSTFQEASPATGIRICAFRGWQEDSEMDVPVGRVKVTISGPSPSNVSQWTSTTSKGAALFFLEKDKVGDYQVNAEAPTPMILLPRSVPFNVTVPKDGWAKERVYVEYPCFVSITLRDAISNTIINRQGNLVWWSPFQRDGVTKPFSSAPISEDVLGPLWPLGSGYPGAYAISIQDVNNYHDGEWEDSLRRPVKEDGTTWDGTFPAPDKHLLLTVYLVPIPPTPRDEEVDDATTLDWLNGTSHTIIQKETRMARDQDGVLRPVKFLSGNSQTMIKLTTGTTDLTAAAMYWERGLSFDDAHLILGADLFKFSYPVVLKNKNNKQGILTLRVPEDAGFGIDGSRIDGGTPGIRYGEVHFVSGIFNGDPPTEANLLKKGAFYFPHNISLPEEIDRLIPWHKLN